VLTPQNPPPGPQGTFRGREKKVGWKIFKGFLEGEGRGGGWAVFWGALWFGGGGGVLNLPNPPLGTQLTLRVPEKNVWWKIF